MALRTPLSVTPHLYMGDSTGRPLDKGVVYFGEQDKDPEFYPINLFSDDALTLPLAQPVHTKGGYLYDKGDMVEPHAKELIYSVKVLDSYGRKVFYKGAMMRNSWNDDVIEQINAALVSTAEQSAQIATDVAKEIADKAVVSSGFVTIDSFELGATLTQRNQALRHTADGKLYRWAGDLPKTVIADSTPTSSGGFGDNAWLEVSDVTLRQDLANPTMGATMVGRGVVAVDSIADLLALPVGQRKADLTYIVSAYHGGWASESPFVGPTGGGEFRYDASRAGENNGGTVLDGFVRVLRSEALSPDMFGITSKIGDEAANDARFVNLMTAGVPKIVFERMYRTSKTVVVPSAIQSLEGVSMYKSGVICTDAGEHVFTIEESVGWVVRNIHASHTARGAGDGFNIQGVNRSFSMYNAFATRCNNGFHFDGVVYVGSLYSCRTQTSNCGFRSTNAAGNSTSFNLEHCYATDISGFGFEMNGCHTVNLIQPIMDVNNSDCVGFIKVVNCSVLNISNAHLEGAPNVAGDAIRVQGTTCDIVNIDGFHSDLACASENLWHFLHMNYAGNTSVRINGVDATKSSNLGLYRVNNSLGNHATIEIGATNRFGTTTTRNRTGVAGELTVNNPIIRGTARGVSSGTFIPTGLHFAPENIQLTMRNAVGGHATVIPSYDEAVSSGSFKIQFTSIADGTRNTSGTFDVDWQVSRTRS